MKRTLALDFTAERDTLSRMVDAWFARQVALRWPLVALHAAKARLAHQVIAGGDAHAAIAIEAAARQLEPRVLAEQILRRAGEADDAVLTLEEQRFATKREIAAANTGQQLAAIGARFLVPEVI